MSLIFCRMNLNWQGQCVGNTDGRVCCAFIPYRLLQKYAPSQRALRVLCLRLVRLDGSHSEHIYISHIFAVTNILFAQWLGSLVDRVPKLPLVRGCVVVQKLSAFIAYGMFIAMFFWARAELDTPSWTPALDFPALGLIIVAGAVLQASNTCITIAVERDWATCIAEGSSEMLSSLNARLRRIDLLCKLLAPLFVSALSTFMPYLWAAVVMAAFQLLSLVVELFWLGVVYRSCPALARDQAQKDSRQPLTNEDGEDAPREGIPCVPCLDACGPNRNKDHWSEFARLPIFLSSLSASFIYMTVLS